jgi:hypothetical protein
MRGVRHLAAATRPAYLRTEVKEVGSSSLLVSQPPPFWCGEDVLPSLLTPRLTRTGNPLQ